MRTKKTILILVFVALAVSLGVTSGAAQEEKTREHFLNEAIEHEKKGEIDAAILSYKGAIQKDPKYVDALNNLGAIYFKQKDYQNALSMFKQAVEADPSHADANANLGRVEMVLKKYAEAEAAFRAALAAKPDAPDVLGDLGQVYYYKKDWPALIKTMNKFHASDPGDYKTWYMLGKAYQSDDRLDDAAQAYSKSIGFESNYSAHFGLGQIYYQQSKFGKAASEYNAAYKANPKGFRAMYNYAIAVESSDPENYGANISAWQEFVDAAGNNSRARKELTEAKNHIKELKEAKERVDLQ